MPEAGGYVISIQLLPESRLNCIAYERISCNPRESTLAIHLTRIVSVNEKLSPPIGETRIRAVFFTDNVREHVAEPPAFVAVTVYAVDGDQVVGVPVIAPVAVLKVKPAGSAGDMENDATAPPDNVGLAVSIAMFTVKNSRDIEYTRLVGGAIVTVIESETVTDPAVLVAVTV
jgi:hypothetical protein